MPGLEDRSWRNLEIVNAAGPLTRLGGHRMHPDVVAAMAEAAGRHLAIRDLEAWAGDRIAAITGAEAGYVTSGASAGLFLATAAIVAGDDPAAIQHLPEHRGPLPEVIVHRLHRNDYDHAIRAVGVGFVEIGLGGYPGAGRTHRWELEAAFSESTVAVAYPIQRAPGALPLETVVSIAHEHGVPVIVDAAASLPPRANLSRFVDAGADIVVFSGGKAIGGPQASGIVAGRRLLIDRIALHHQDMDIHPDLWRSVGWPDRIEDGPPFHGVGRSLKVGKESIVGLITALERFVEADESAEADRLDRRLRAIQGGLSDIPGIVIELVEAGPATKSYPFLELSWRAGDSRSRAVRLMRQLMEGRPPIHLGSQRLDEGIVAIVPTTVSDDDVALIIDRIRACLSDRR
jgi:L-seryl-tRNA(Ser) seleniumtransferase